MICCAVVPGGKPGRTVTAPRGPRTVMSPSAAKGVSAPVGEADVVGVRGSTVESGLGRLVVASVPPQLSLAKMST